MICFLFISILYLKNKQKKATTSETSRSPFLKLPSRRENPKKRPYFPLPVSILAGTNLIMLLFFFFNPRLIPNKIHSPFDFRENSSSFDFRGNPCQTPKVNQKNCLFFLLPVFFGSVLGVFFAFVPFDLNSTNPKSTISEPG